MPHGGSGFVGLADTNFATAGAIHSTRRTRRSGGTLRRRYPQIAMTGHPRRPATLKIERMNSRLGRRHAALPRTFPEQVARIADLRAAGVPRSTVDRRCRPGGPWRRLLPGVVLLGAGEPSRRQWVRAAALYGGADAVVTGLDALAAHGVLLPEVGPVHVLVPQHRRRNDREFVLTERTSRLPCATRIDGMRFATPARATLDAARRQTEPDAVAALLGASVRQGACTVPELRHELDAGGQRGSRTVRVLLGHMAAGVRSITEQQARRVVARCPIPVPQWNVPLADSSGTLLGVVDAWWPDTGLVWDLGAQDFRIPDGAAPVHRSWHSALLAHHVTILRTPPRRLHQDPAAIRRALLIAYFRAGRRPRPSVHAVTNRSVSLRAVQLDQPVG